MERARPRGFKISQFASLRREWGVYIDRQLLKWCGNGAVDGAVDGAVMVR